LLVGKTASNSNTVGFQAGQNGFTAITRASGQPLILDRTTTPGAIQEFRKDGAPVGSIGSISGGIEITAPTYLVLGCDDTGIRIASNEYVLPFNPSTNALKDGAVSLGVASSRFKDLYLSGGVYLGGTGAANKLDDYETGTFTPVMENVTGWSGSSGIDGHYTKIGDTVHVFISMTSNVALTGTPTHKITGLPFSSNLPERISNVSISRMFGIGLTATDYIAGVSGTEIQFSYVNGDNNVNNLTHSGSTLRFTLCATYKTAA